ncbi:MAG: O-antigen ligase family protein [Cyclobacteriaceae bacterium]|nr:O-antigen ligase family protein [Cyclobacteriaceae bacterium]
MITTLPGRKFWLPLILVVVNILLVILSGKLGSVIPVLVMGSIIMLGVLIISYYYPRFNILFLLACGLLIPFLMRALSLYDIPIGLASEALCIILFLTIVLNKRIGGLKSLPGVLILVWIAFLSIELLNPVAASRVAGFVSLRGLLPFVCSFFIMYSSIEGIYDVKTFIKGWFILCSLAGLYGLYQEFAGLPAFDMAWATHDENLYGALFTWGRLRKFSFFVSPSEFAIVMVVTGLAGLVLLFFEKPKSQLFIYSGITAFICLWAMIYTGSRTAMVMLPAGFVALLIITLKRKVFIVVGALVVFGALLMLRPTSNALFVMSTAFSGADDPSMNVRLKNQQIIRAYILEHPIGFGLGSTGYLGMKYSPESFVANFPPDSEYVRIAIETGWIGLLIWSIIQAILFGYGVTVYFKAPPKWKGVIVMILVSLFMLIVAQYPQEIFRSQVLTVLYCGMLGMLARIDHIHQSKEISESLVE